MQFFEIKICKCSWDAIKCDKRKYLHLTLDVCWNKNFKGLNQSFIDTNQFRNQSFKIRLPWELLILFMIHVVGIATRPVRRIYCCIWLYLQIINYLQYNNLWMHLHGGSISCWINSLTLMTQRWKRNPSRCCWFNSGVKDFFFWKCSVYVCLTEKISPHLSLSFSLTSPHSIIHFNDSTRSLCCCWTCCYHSFCYFCRCC